MKDVLLYLSAFFMIFLSCAVVCFCLRFSMWIYLEYWSPQLQQHRRRRPCQARDRQGNVFTIHDENSRESRYNDIFFIEPNSVEAARIRAQLEKDDKDLPSYEEVMRMTSMNPPPPTTTTNTAEMGASNASVNTTETRLSVPPYSEIDPNASSTSLNASSLMATATPSSDSTLPTHSQSAPPPLFAAAVVSSSVTQTTSNV
uniref:Putative secreted protein n=1 Tax=Haematobia irritans TaxID=7368 RepID=A0A1L8EJ08_HAEIR